MFGDAVDVHNKAKNSLRDFYPRIRRGCGPAASVECRYICKKLKHISRRVLRPRCLRLFYGSRCTGRHFVPSGAVRGPSEAAVCSRAFCDRLAGDRVDSGGRGNRNPTPSCNRPSCDNQPPSLRAIIATATAA